MHHGGGTLTVLFAKRFWPGIADGSVTVTFRRWRRVQVVTGRRYRTPAGIVEVEAVDAVAPGAISDEDAGRSGYPDAASLRADLRGTPDLPVYRIAFRRVAGPDPRDELAARDELSDADVAELDRRLSRLDTASGRGPWTRDVLAAIAARPGTRAADLAAALGRETPAFKTDVRKLKNLGLTISLDRGYRLSPRGAAYLAACSRGPAAATPGSSGGVVPSTD